MILKSDQKYGKILGISLNSTSEEGVITFVKYRIAKKLKFSIVTPNPEIILASTKDEELRRSINRANLALPDGIGVSQAAKFLSLKAPANFLLRFLISFFQGLLVGVATFIKRDWITSSLRVLPGRKIFLKLISLADKNSWKVFLLGGETGISEKTAKILTKKYPKIKFASADGPRINKNASPVTEIDILIQKSNIEKINKFNPQLLFLALGPTKQEKWIIKNLPKLNVGGAMTVGGTFNYISGKSKLPSSWSENLGLEWVWRLINEPWRFFRILNAFPLFPLKIFWIKVTQK